MAGHRCRLLDHLDPAGPGADDPDPAPGQLESVGRPAGGVAPGAGEVGQAGQRGHVGAGAEPGAGDEEAAVVADLARWALGGEAPAPVLGVPVGGGDPGVEVDVGRQVEHPVDVVEVGHQLVPAGEPLGPGPVPPHLGQGVLVVGDVGVDPGPRIAVRPPHPAQSGRGLDQSDREPVVAEPPQLVEAVEPGPDHDHVMAGHRLDARSWPEQGESRSARRSRAIGPWAGAGQVRSFCSCSTWAGR